MRKLLVRGIGAARLLGLAALAAIATGCGGSAPRPVAVLAQGFRFTPSTLELTYQQPYRLLLRNPDTVEHDFQVDTFPMKAGNGGGGGGHQHAPAGNAGAETLHVHAAAGRESSLTFTPLARGEFDVYCTIPGHKELGMVARLIVR